MHVYLTFQFELITVINHRSSWIIGKPFIKSYDAGTTSVWSLTDCFFNHFSLRKISHTNQNNTKIKNRTVTTKTIQKRCISTFQSEQHRIKGSSIIINHSAPSCLGPFTYVANLLSRQGLRSSCSNCLVEPPVHRSTVGSQAFSVVGPHVWNYLPPEVMSVPSLVTFRTQLETFLFTESSWHSAYLTFLCLCTVYSGPSSVLNN